MRKCYKLLKWDTKHFGYKVALIENNNIDETTLDNVIKNLKRRNYRLAYWIVDSNLIKNKSLANKLGGVFVDERLLLKKRIYQNESRTSKRLKTNIVNKHACFSMQSYIGKKITKRLKKLALEAGRHSRFYIDDNFVNKEYYTLYINWMTNSLNGKNADYVFVYKKKNIECGFITLTTKNKSLYIDLISVDYRYRRKGVGSELIKKASEIAHSLKMSTIFVVTQKANINAVMFYKYLGFKIIKKSYIFHFWIN